MSEHLTDFLPALPMASQITTGPYCPLGLDEKITIPILMTKYNPDNVPADKLVHIDTIANKSLTYGGLREQAAKCAWGLKHKLGLNEQDRMLVIVPNSVCRLLAKAGLFN